MRIRIYSVKEVLYEGEGTSLNLKTQGGELTVLSNHRPLITAVVKGTITVIDKEGWEKRFPVENDGFLEVTGENEVKVLLS